MSSKNIPSGNTAHSITPSERAHRERVVKSVTGSFALEDMAPDEHTTRQLQQFVDGHLTMDDLVAGIPQNNAAQ